ncbi:MAG TPA: tetratricopeptide repeat protein [Candidatus Hydrogenedentes bacterium]|nr:tetratricopeptide repeat protein [Candidatus Hydrogenedentota bacterium]HNT89712.1 tetratricopeptide repeat protein [Candidatus Hydrogenedentota bacterium]
MAKTRKERLREYGSNVAGQLRRALRREVAPADAVKTLYHDTRHLAKRMLRGEQTKERKRAKQFLQQGVEAYNSRCYDRAHSLFDKALYHDGHFALAWAYMGNAHYKLGHYGEAVQAWQKAVEVEPGSRGAAMAKEKLAKVGTGNEGVFAAIKDQMHER